MFKKSYISGKSELNLKGKQKKLKSVFESSEWIHVTMKRIHVL